jgi:Short C-terminal domain
MLRRRPIMRMAATTAVVAGTATAVSGGVRRHEEAKAQQQQDAAAAEAAPAAYAEAAPEVGPPAEDPYEQLEKLGKLHEQGILTDEEFSAAKAKLLG